jgi:hypothetical protein
VNVGVHEKVPDVLPAPAVNVLPVVAGEEAAVKDVMALPSGSFAVTVNERRTPSFTVCVAGAVTTGARSPLTTVSVVAALPERPFAAVNVSVNVPVIAGFHEKVPLVLPAPAVNVLPVVAGVLTSVNDVIAWPSGSDAVTVTVPGVPVVKEAVAGAVTTGARSTLFTVTVVAAVPERAFCAVTVTVYVPACVNVGVHEKVPLVLPAPAVNVLPVVAGVEAAVKDVIASPSGSTAVTV